MFVRQLKGKMKTMPQQTWKDQAFKCLNQMFQTPYGGQVKTFLLSLTCTWAQGTKYDATNIINFDPVYTF